MLIVTNKNIRLVKIVASSIELIELANFTPLRGPFKARAYEDSNTSYISIMRENRYISKYELQYSNKSVSKV